VPKPYPKEFRDDLATSWSRSTRRSTVMASRSRSSRAGLLPTRLWPKPGLLVAYLVGGAWEEFADR
jgi:hypothetical protein